MKGQLKVSTPAEYIAKLNEPRKSEIAALDKMIRKLAPKLAPFIQAGMLAYGPWHYKYASGREGDWFRIGLASNKNYISLYICATDGKTYVAEKFKESLPKASIGKKLRALQASKRFGPNRARQVDSQRCATAIAGASSQIKSRPSPLAKPHALP